MVIAGTGPFDPTTFSWAGRTWGLVICYEGFYPTITGDYSQMIALQQQNASTVLWSVGSSAGLLVTEAKLLSKRFRFQMAGTEDAEAVVHLSSAALVGADGSMLPSRDAPVGNVTGIGYTGKAIVRSALL